MNSKQKEADQGLSAQRRRTGPWEIVIASPRKIEIRKNGRAHKSLSQKINSILTTKSDSGFLATIDILFDVLQRNPQASYQTIYKTVSDNTKPGKTFPLPSHPIIFTLLAMFAGKPKKMPRKLLEKPPNQRTVFEQKEVEEFLKSIIETKENVNPYLPRIVEVEKLALVCNNPIVEAKARITDTLFGGDHHCREESLAYYIKQTFGPEGLRHLLGIIICIEEQGRQKEGYFEWSVNEHLERLGFQKENRSYNINIKKRATSIMRILLNLVIVARRKNARRKGYNIEFEKLFNWVKGHVHEKDYSAEVFHGTIIIRAEDYWYRNAFVDTNGKTPQYTKLLKKIAQECHRDHGITIYLSPLLAVFWRMTLKGQKFKVKTLMDWCDIDWNGHNRRRDLNNLIKELDYMIAQGYLGKWSHNGDLSDLTCCNNPFDLTLILYPPDWLREEIETIKGKTAEFLPQSSKTKKSAFSQEDFTVILEKSGLSTRKFAEKLGINPSMVTHIKKGRKPVSKKLAEKMKEIFGDFFP